MTGEARRRRQRRLLLPELWHGPLLWRRACSSLSCILGCACLFSLTQILPVRQGPPPSFFQKPSKEISLCVLLVNVAGHAKFSPLIYHHISLWVLWPFLLCPPQGLILNEETPRKLAGFPLEWSSFHPDLYHTNCPTLGSLWAELWEQGHSEPELV